MKVVTLTKNLEDDRCDSFAGENSGLFIHPELRKSQQFFTVVAIGWWGHIYGDRGTRQNGRLLIMSSVDYAVC
jgi:hypothetical protein